MEINISSMNKSNQYTTSNGCVAPEHVKIMTFVMAPSYD